MPSRIKNAFSLYMVTGIMVLLCPVPASADTPGTIGKFPASAGSSGALLLNDSRLNVLISLRRQECMLTEALYLLGDMAHVSLKVKAGEDAAWSRISLRYKAGALRDIMDSLACLYTMAWQRKGNTYVLYSKHQADEEATHPRSEAEASVYREGNAFLQQMKTLSADAQSALYYNNEDASRAPKQGLPFTELPASLQQTVRAMFAASSESQDAAGLSSPLSEADLASSHVRIQGGSAGLSSKHLSIDVGNANGAMCIGFYAFPNPNEDNYRIISPHQSASPLMDKSSPASQQETLQNDARLKRKITFRGRHLTFVESLQMLSLQEQISFVADNSRMEAATKSFSYADVSIEEALNRLSSLYGFTRDTRPHVNFLAPGTQLIPQGVNKPEANHLEHYVYAWRIRPHGIFVFRPALDDQGVISPANASNFQQEQQK